MGLAWRWAGAGAGQGGGVVPGDLLVGRRHTLLSSPSGDGGPVAWTAQQSPSPRQLGDARLSVTVQAIPWFVCIASPFKPWPVWLVSPLRSSHGLYGLYRLSVQAMACMACIASPCKPCAVACRAHHQARLAEPTPSSTPTRLRPTFAGRIMPVCPAGRPGSAAGPHPCGSESAGRVWRAGRAMPGQPESGRGRRRKKCKRLCRPACECRAPIIPRVSRIQRSLERGPV